MKIDDADGYMDLELAGNETPVRIDVFVAHDTFLDSMSGYEADADGAGNDYFARLKKAAAVLGLPDLSGRTVELIRKAIADRMAELKKKDGSPAPTQ